MNKLLMIAVVKLVSLVPFYLSAQDRSYVPPSPTAASLGKYGDIPVSNYTGIPNISIPLYTISNKSFSLPISLNYHASGIKVDDEASWVGLGWSLQAGGVITRTVRGRDDLPTEGVNYTPYPNYIMPLSADNDNNYVPPSNPSANSQFLREVGDSGKDVEPDVFYFNFAGHSGKFFIQQRQTVNSPYSFILESQEKIKIELFPPTYNTGWSWVFTMADGVKYYFGTEEKSRGYNGVSEVVPHSPTGTYLGEQELYMITSSWYLDQIVSPNGEIIDFVYTSAPTHGSRRTKSLSEERMYNIGTQIHNQTPGCSPEGPPPYHKYFSSFSVIFDVYLKEINFNGGKVDFQIIDRDDIQPMGTLGQKAKKLDKITISSINQTTHDLTELKSFQFGYSYFTSIDSYVGIGYPSGQTVDPTYSGKRLKLNSLMEKTGLISLPPYEFSYHQTSYVYGDIPNKYSRSKDHWGFFNNAFNGFIYDGSTSYVTTLIPSYLDVNQSKYYNGADREANESQIILGTIKQIKYPTGGTTDFEFESNDFSNFPDQNKVQLSNKGIAAAGAMINDPEIYIGTDAEDEILLTFSKTTVLKLTAYFSYSDEHCYGSSNPGYGGTGGISVRNDVNTPYFSSGAAPSGAIECSGGETVLRHIVVPPGTYKIKAQAEDHFIATANLVYEEITNNPLMEIKGGGIRIARIKDYNGIDHGQDKVTSFKYTHLDNMGRERSSGILMSPLAYAYQMSLGGSRSCGGNGYGVSWTTTYLKRTSGSTISLGNSAQGSAVGYSQVTILSSQNGEQGQTVLDYYNQADQLPNTFFPNIPNQPGPINGILKKKTIYKRSSQSPGPTMLKVSETSWEYASEVSKRKVAKGVRCMGCESMYEAMLQGIPYIPIIKFYDSISEWWRPISETTVEYDSAGANPLSKTINYYYDNLEHMQVTRKETTNSNGKIQTTMSIYPEDYVGITNGFVFNLKSNHIVNKSIEEVVLLKENPSANPKVMSGRIIEYDGNGLERKIFSIEEGKSTDLSVYKFSNAGIGEFPFSTTPSSAGFIADNRYKEKMKLYPDGSFGNVVMVEPSNSSPISYMWGYFDKYPIAECKNAANDEFFYLDFEGNGLLAANSNIYHTGEGGYNGSIVLSNYFSASHNGRSYRLSYFKYAGGKWNEVTVPYTGQTIVGELDDIRIFPVDAQMTSYTYKPLVGMTSMTDASGRTTYYEYDGFGRLAAIRDKDRNVIKQICYNYAGQQTNCALVPFTVAMWEPTGNTRCLKNAFDLNTGYQEQEERDTNTESPSYNQIRWVSNGVSASCPIPPQTYSNVEMSDDFIKQGCTYTDGSIVTYTVPAGTYLGGSQAEADYKAENDLFGNGQDYANVNGTCPVPDAYISIENVVWTYQGTMADLVLYFYDPDTYGPVYVNNMPISYTQYAYCTPSGNWSNPTSTTVSGSSLLLQSYVPLNFWQYIPNPDPWVGGMITEDCEYEYVLNPSQFYNAY